MTSGPRNDRSSSPGSGHHPARRRRRVHVGGAARRALRRPAHRRRARVGDGTTAGARSPRRSRSSPTEVLPRVQARRLDRCEQVALVAAKEAWAHAGCAPRSTRERLAVVIGTGIGGAVTLLDQDDLLESRRAAQGLPAHRADADAQRARGLGRASSSGARRACTRRSRRARPAPRRWPGRCGCSARARSTWSSPAAPRPASPASPWPGSCRPARCPSATTSRSGPPGPFDADRDGFVLGEGAGIMVLERAEFAAARGATVHGRLAGAGITSDAYHITGPEPEGSGPVPGHHRGGAHARARAGRHRARQLPRHLHGGRRRRRDPRGAQGAGRPPGAHRAEVGARVTWSARPARSRASSRCSRSGGRHPGHAQPGRTSTPASSWTWWRASPARSTWTPRSATRSASAGTTPPSPSPGPDSGT